MENSSNHFISLEFSLYKDYRCIPHFKVWLLYAYHYLFLLSFHSLSYQNIEYPSTSLRLVLVFFCSILCFKTFSHVYIRWNDLIFHWFVPFCLSIVHIYSAGSFFLWSSFFLFFLITWKKYLSTSDFIYFAFVHLHSSFFLIIEHLF